MSTPLGQFPSVPLRCPPDYYPAPRADRGVGPYNSRSRSLCGGKEVKARANPPITDLFMEYSDTEPPDPPLDGQWWTHNGNHALFVRAWPGPLYGLNTGAIINTFDRKQKNYIYLWLTRDETKPPIKDLQVVLGEPDSAFPDWETVCWQNTTTPANTNKGSFYGKEVYIKFRR